MGYACRRSVAAAVSLLLLCPAPGIAARLARPMAIPRASPPALVVRRMPLALAAARPASPASLRASAPAAISLPLSPLVAAAETPEPHQAAAASEEAALPAAPVRSGDAAGSSGSPVLDLDRDRLGNLSSLFDGGHHQLPALIPDQRAEREQLAKASALRDDLLHRSRVRLEEANREIRLLRRTRLGYTPGTPEREEARSIETGAQALVSALRKHDYAQAELAYRKLGESINPSRFEGNDFRFVSIDSENRAELGFIGTVAGFGAAMFIYVVELNPLSGGILAMASILVYQMLPFTRSFRPLPLSPKDAKRIRSLVPDVFRLTSPFTETRREKIKELGHSHASAGDIAALKLLAQRDHHPRLAAEARRSLGQLGTDASREALRELEREDAERVELLKSASPPPSSPAPRNEAPPDLSVMSVSRLLETKRSSLPFDARSRLDEISEELPRLDQRLAQSSGYDMAAHEARLLLKRHIPELIEAYERVPLLQRDLRDNEGMTADERLIRSLDLVAGAIKGLNGRISAAEQAARQALEAKGRYLENRYGNAGLSSD